MQAYKIKKENAIQKIQEIGRFAKKWVLARREVYRNLVVDLIEHVASQDLLVTLMSRWERKLIFI